MRNTLIPLDMIFIRADGTIARIAANTVPLSEEPVGVEPAERGARAARRPRGRARHTRGRPGLLERLGLRRPTHRR